MGADVVKVEPITGESGRGSQPSMVDPEGRSVGATFLRNNLDKRSLALDLRSDKGRELFLRLVPRFDVVAENFKAGAMDRLGLGYDDVAKVHPPAIYVSVSGFGNRGDSPYRDWPPYSATGAAPRGRGGGTTWRTSYAPASRGGPPTTRSGRRASSWPPPASPSDPAWSLATSCTNPTSPSATCWSPSSAPTASSSRCCCRAS